MNASRPTLAAATVARRRAALDDVQRARLRLVTARQVYHRSLVIAHNAGIPPEGIAASIGTRPAYVADSIRRHESGECGCNL